MKFPNIEALILDGWQLDVSNYGGGKFKACVYRRRYGDGHNHLGGNVMEALEGLERYVQSPGAREWRSSNGRGSPDAAE